MKTVRVGKNEMVAGIENRLVDRYSKVKWTFRDKAMEVLAQGHDREYTLKMAREAESRLQNKMKQSLNQQLSMMSGNRSNSYLLLDIPGLDAKDT